jgi:hypothetical protein
MILDKLIILILMEIYLIVLDKLFITNINGKLFNSS